ncbi:MAG: hypothetical protein JWN56_1550 [Sphingobacteriales bacterium]|nr:hypothetical protein [Sphingobacteriales bacterium]
MKNFVNKLSKKTAKISFLILSAVMALNLSANAQIQGGNIMIGGNLANINVGLDKPSVFNLDVTPKVAWFLVDNVALGGYVNLGIQTAKGSPTITRYGVGALGRYYTGSDVEALRHGRLFGEATVGVGGQNVGGGGGKTNGLDFSFGPGFSYFITNNIGLETLLKYNGITGFGNEGYQHNLNLSFGLQIYLPGRGTAAKVKGDVK